MKQETISDVLIASSNRRHLLSSIHRYFFRLLYILHIFLKRAIEIVISSLILPFSLVLLITLTVRKIISKKPIFTVEEIYGKNGKKIALKAFNLNALILSHLSYFFYVLLGDLSLVGVSIKHYNSKERTLGDSYLFNSRPGIFSLWFIRDSSKISHDGKLSVEWEYVFKQSIVSDLLLILKTIPAMLYHETVSSFSEVVNIFGINFKNITMKSAVSTINEAIENEQDENIFFVNPDCLNKVFSDKEYYNILLNKGTVFPDGIGVKIACKILKSPLKENINGTDMLPYICDLAVGKKYKIFLLGGAEGIAETMKGNLEKKYKDISICGTHHGFFNRESDENQIVIDKINQSEADIVLVAFGAPFQEKWRYF